MNTRSKLLLAAGAGLAAVLTSRALLRRSRRFSFAGKAVLITGGSRGLGLELAWCPHCQQSGALIGHGVLRGYAECTSEVVVRGRRVFCSNRARGLAAVAPFRCGSRQCSRASLCAR